MSNTKTQTLANRIQKHDIYACMSDSDSVYQKEQKIKSEILSELGTLSLKEKHELVSLIEDERYVRYFELNELPELPKPVSIRSRVFRAAWYFFNKGIYESFSQALKAAWKAIKIKAAMMVGNVTLKFRKTTGEIRTAIATLKLNNEYKSKAPAKYTPDVLKFYDKSVEGWRSARIERIIAA